MIQNRLKMCFDRINTLIIRSSAGSLGFPVHSERSHSSIAAARHSLSWGPPGCVLYSILVLRSLFERNNLCRPHYSRLASHGPPLLNLAVAHPPSLLLALRTHLQGRHTVPAQTFFSLEHDSIVQVRFYCRFRSASRGTGNSTYPFVPSLLGPNYADSVVAVAVLDLHASHRQV